MDKLSVFPEFSEIVSCFRYFNSRGLVGGGGRLIVKLRGIRYGVEHADSRLMIYRRRLFNIGKLSNIGRLSDMQERKSTPEKIRDSRRMCTAGKEKNRESTK
jgi:hypothetical protein